MTLPTDPYNFTNGSTADAEQVDARFAALYAALSAGGLDAAVLASEAWTASTPTVTQSGTVAATVTHSRYVRLGRTIMWSFRLDVTGAGTYGNAIALSLPVAARAGNVFAAGTGYIYDASGPSMYVGAWHLASTTTLHLIDSDVASFASVGASPSVTLASGDVISGTVTYEAAS
ncbi:MAG TPA: hypothetical protein PKD63_00290 [Solirubrobacteraceae bacterium]|nr:hypothetical protein [Solirubrobacteraceae bacterium]